MDSDNERVEIGINLKPEVYRFRQYTKEEIKDIFEKSHEQWNVNACEHPEFNDVQAERITTESLAAFWKDCANVFPEYSDEDQYWTQIVKQKRRNEEEWERKIAAYPYEYGGDILYMAGLLAPGEEIVADALRGQTDIIRKILDTLQFPKSMQISFQNDRLCVNDVATKITEESVNSAYTGLAALASHNKAVDYIAHNICKKLKRLF